MAESSPLAERVGAVEDPFFARSLESLGMLKTVGDRSATILVPVSDYPLVERLSELVREVGVEELTLEEMPDPERAKMAKTLSDTAGPKIGAPGSRTRVVAISSGKGGVGKSSVTVNLAVALQRAGKRVGVIDADIWGFSIPRMLGVDHPPVVLGEVIVPPAAHGVRVISMGYFVPDGQAVIWRGPLLHKAVEQFLGDVWWDNLDFLLVDTPPGTGDVSISLSQLVPRIQVLLVTTPQPTAERVARRAGLMAQQVDQEVMGVVENMSWFTGDDGKRYEIFGSGGGEELATKQGVDLLAKIPFLPELRQGADDGVVAEVNSEAGEAFALLAGEVVSRQPKVIPHPNLVIE